MNFGLPSQTLKAIQTVFDQWQDLEKVVIYGSRAQGNHRPNSDIDLCLYGPSLTLKSKYRIEEMLDDLMLPYKIDLSIHHDIENSELLTQIDRVGKEFWVRNKQLDNVK